MENIELNIIEKVIKTNKLGCLTIYYKKDKDLQQTSEPRNCEFCIDLKKLFIKIINNKSISNTMISYNDIETIVLFGSVLYKHIPVFTKKTEKIYKNRTGIRTRIIKEKIPKQFPNGIDILIILKSKLLNIPKKINILENVAENKLFEKYDLYMGSGIRLKQKDEIPLHITFLTKTEFLNGINDGENIVTYISTFGIPFVGQKNFYKLLSHIKNNKRKIMHKIKWKMNKTGFCEIVCTPKLFSFYSLKQERNRRRAINISPGIKNKFTRFEIIDI